MSYRNLPMVHGYHLLCILTCKRMLCMPFAGPNQLTLKQFFSSLTEENKKQESKVAQKHAKRGVYQRLGVTLKRWFTPKIWLTSGGNCNT